VKEDKEMVMHRKAVLWVATIAIAAGILTACSSSGDDGPARGDLPTSTPVPASTGTPSPSFGALEPGKYVLSTFDPDFDASYRITMDLLDGYEGVDGGPVNGGSGNGQGISAWTVGNVYAHPCHWVGTLLDPPAGPSVDGLVEALASQPQRHASRPTDVELGGFTGTFMEMTVPAGIDLAGCHDGQFRTWVDPALEGARWLEPGQRDLLWIVDVDGRRLVIDAALGVGTSAQDRADRIQMVESIRIEPI
jgi:hypothetical protein